MLLVAGSGFAENQFLYPVKVDFGFPYLSPVLEQRQILINAFSFQMSLFGAINGAGAKPVLALNYLAMTGVLIGALLIIFNPKYRKAATVAPWLLLVIITVFAPYGSKLLFSPTQPSGLTQGLTGGSVVSNDCMKNPSACGFTPQLAALHVASLLQLTFSDIFNSNQWKGLIGQAVADAALRSNVKFAAAPDWADKVADFRNDCGNQYDWDTMIANRMGTSASAATNAAGATAASTGDIYVMQTLGDQWNRIVRPYFSDKTSTFESYPPNMMQLYDESDYPGTAATGDSSEFTKKVWNGRKSSYEAGIQAIYRRVTNDSNQKVMFDASEPGSISIKEALTRMNSNFGFFKVIQPGSSSNSGIWPGFFFYWAGATNASGTDGATNANAGAVGGQSAVGLVAAADYRQCYNGGTDGVNTSDSKCAAGVFSNTWYNTQEHVKSLKTFLDPAPGTPAPGSPWDNLVDLFSDHNIGAMPVGIIHFPIFNPSTKAAVTPSAAEPVMSCKKQGDRLIDEALDWTLGVPGKAKMLQPLNKMLVKDRVVSASTDANALTTLTVDQLFSTTGMLCTDSAYAAKKMQCNVYSQDDDKALANNVVMAFDSAERNEQGRLHNNLTQEDRYRVLLKMVIKSIEDSTLKLSNTLAEQQAGKDRHEIDKNLVGSSLLTTVGGWAAVFMGEQLAEIGTWITGPLSKAIVYFLSLLVDMALLALIVLTPIMFFIALAMPGAAMGVLTICVMGAFILKVVPITLLVLNNIGGMIYTMIGQGGGDDKHVMENLLILAMAGLYANVVGMTFFLLFKLGDPATVLSRFTALDGSAKQIADRGMAAAIAVASVAALAAGGGVGSILGRFGAAGFGEGSAGAKLASGMRAEAAKKLGGIVGAPNSITKAAVDGVSDSSTKTTEGLGGTGGAGTDKDGKYLDSFGNEITNPAMLEKLKAADAQDLRAREAANFTDGEMNELITSGVVTNSNGDMFKWDGGNNSPEYMRAATAEDMKEISALRDPMAQEMIANAKADPLIDLNDTQLNQLAMTGKATSDDGKEYGIKKDADGWRAEQTGVNTNIQAQRAIEGNMPNGRSNQIRADKPDGVDAGASGQSVAEDALAQNAIEGNGPGARSSQIRAERPDGVAPQGSGEDAVAQGVVEGNRPNARSDQSRAGNIGGSNPDAAAQAAVEGQGQIPADASRNIGGVASGIQDVRLVASEVSLASGAATGDTDSVTQTQLSRMEEDDHAANQLNEIKRIDSAIKAPGASAELIAAGELAKEEIRAADSNTLKGAANNWNKTLLAQGTSQAQVDEAAGLRTNLAQQNAALLKDHAKQYKTEFGEIDQILKANPSLDTKDKRLNAGVTNLAQEKLISERTDLNAFDPVMAVEAELARRGEVMTQIRKDLDIKGKADLKPGFLLTALSGVYGGLSGAGGGLAKIPVIGTAITEAANEYYQAPERARAIRAAGGVGGWMNKNSDAKRMGFYQKEMAPIGAGQQYQAMGAIGGFQAQADLARQTANEAVAKSQSQFSAMLADKQAKFTSENVNLSPDDFVRAFETAFKANNFEANMNINDLQGLGTFDAANRVSSVRQEAYVMQGKGLKTKAVELDENFMLRTGPDGKVDVANVKAQDRDVQLTADVLNKIVGDNSNKKIASSIDDMMVMHYGLVEKQYLRGDVKWNATRDMTTSAGAASLFATQDVDADYAVGGHLKMVEGKIKFKDMQGQYQTLVEMRHEENSKKHEEIIKMVLHAGGGKPDYMKALANIGYDVSSELDAAGKAKYSPAQLVTVRRAALDKAAKVSLQADGKLLPLEAVFDEAAMSGTKKYWEKSYAASVSKFSENAKITKTVNSGVVESIKGWRTLPKSVQERAEVRYGKTRVALGDALQNFAEMVEKGFDKDLSKAGLYTTIMNDVFSNGPNMKTVDQVIKNAAGQTIGQRTGFAIDDNALQTFANRLTAAGEGIAAQRILDSCRSVNGERVFYDVALMEEGDKVTKLVNGKK